MSEGKNERDTQFQGFAHALLLQLAEENALALNWERFFGELELTVARRSYDFACHLIKNGDPIDLDTSGEYSPMADEEAQRRVNNLPDLTELPKEQE
jgi:hypothetical protein